MIAAIALQAVFPAFAQEQPAQPQTAEQFYANAQQLAAQAEIAYRSKPIHPTAEDRSNAYGWQEPQRPSRLEWHCAALHGFIRLPNSFRRVP
ncbi:MAG: hypothetical protein HC933_12335 [Pleurocapsa sp. SU_196_0]|nr:hypothetical protein [Pleurocapsa sp. SU_196_0]